MALFAAAFCHAQNATITGTVKDGDMNDFLIGASVFVEGTAHGTIADANGSYNLSVPYGKVTVCCDFLGYKPQEIELELEAGEVRKQPDQCSRNHQCRVGGKAQRTS